MTRALSLVVLLVAVVSGCGGSLEPFETESGSATRLDGIEATVQALSVAEAIRMRAKKPVYVRGYLLAPPDDVDVLCTRLVENGLCLGPALVLDLLRVDLDGARALEHGCCAIGYWSPRPLVLRLRLAHGRRAVALG